MYALRVYRSFLWVCLWMYGNTIASLPYS